MITLCVYDSNKKVSISSTGFEIFECKFEYQTISKTFVDDNELIYILINGGDELSGYHLYCLSQTGLIQWSTEGKLKLEDSAIIDFYINKTKILNVTLSETIEAWSFNTIYKFNSRGKLISTQMNK